MQQVENGSTENRIRKLEAALRLQIMGKQCERHMRGPLSCASTKTCREVSTDKEAWCKYCCAQDALEEYEEDAGDG